VSPLRGRQLGFRQPPDALAPNEDPDAMNRSGLDETLKRHDPTPATRPMSRSRDAATAPADRRGTSLGNDTGPDGQSGVDIAVEVDGARFGTATREADFLHPGPDGTESGRRAVPR
jgi:hypothetical protein